jgi:hypothetical protein
MSQRDGVLRNTWSVMDLLANALEIAPAKLNAG